MRDFWESPEFFSKHRLSRDLFGEGIPATKPAPEKADRDVAIVTATSPEIPPGKLVYKELISVFAAQSGDQEPRIYRYQSVSDRKLIIPRFVRKGDKLRFRAIPWSEQVEKNPAFATMTLDDPLSEPVDDLYFVTEWLEAPGASK